MKGLKPYTHQDREKVVEEMIPLIKKKFGDNLIALASAASFARNEDFDYSDLELMAFVKEMPEGKKWDGMSKIRNGMLVELVWMTKEHYLEDTIEVNPNWYVSGSDVLVPLINKEFIEELNKYKIENIKKKCLYQAVRRWNGFQESIAKVLNGIKKKNKEHMPLLLHYMYIELLAILSFLNQEPYTTLSTFISQAKKFKLKPKGFEELVDIMTNGKYTDLPRLKEAIVTVFSDLEKTLEELGFELYYDNVDPNLPDRYKEKRL